MILWLVLGLFVLVLVLASGHSQPDVPWEDDTGKERDS